MAKTTAKKSKVLQMPKAKKGSTAKAAEAPAKGEKKAAKKATDSKYIGKTTGMRVQEFQDDLMKKNAKAKLTDAQLAKAMRAEFPNAVAFTEDHVAGIRSQYNNGKRASQGGVKPAKPIPRFDDDGNEMAPRTRSEKKAKSAKAEKAPAKKGKKAAEEEPEEDEEDTDDDSDDDGDEEEEEVEEEE